jgi:hypothetical protein
VDWYIAEVSAILGGQIDAWQHAEGFWREMTASALRLVEAYGDPRRAEKLAMGKIRVRFKERAELIATGWVINANGEWTHPD